MQHVGVAHAVRADGACSEALRRNGCVCVWQASFVVRTNFLSQLTVKEPLVPYPQSTESSVG